MSVPAATIRLLDSIHAAIFDKAHTHLGRHTGTIAQNNLLLDQLCNRTLNKSPAPRPLYLATASDTEDRPLRYLRAEGINLHDRFENLDKRIEPTCINHRLPSFRVLRMV